MREFSKLLQTIRDEAGLTQSQLASVLDVSTVLIAMLETGQKEVSKNFVIRLAEKLEVQPSNLMPFVFFDDGESPKRVTNLERKLLSLGEEFQEYLIKKRARLLKRYVE